MIVPAVYVITGLFGSGKTTLGGRVADVLRWPLFDVGAELRHRMESDETFRSVVSPHMSSGSLVPDEIILSLFEGFLEQHNQGSIILVGYPRNALQVRHLLMSEHDDGERVARPIVCITLEIPPEAAFRIIQSSPTDRSERTDQDNGVLERRLQIYQNEIIPAIELLGSRSPDDAWKRVLITERLEWQEPRPSVEVRSAQLLELMRLE